MQATRVALHHIFVVALLGRAHHCFYGSFELRPWQHHSAPATGTLNFKIGSHTDNLPLVAATGVSLFHPDNIAQLKLHRLTPPRSVLLHCYCLN